MAETTNNHPCNVLENIVIQIHFNTEDLTSRAVSGHNATEKTPMCEMQLTFVFGFLIAQTGIEKSSVSGRITNYRRERL